MTNPKISRGALNEFSKFRGVSLVFDNPGNGLVPSAAGSYRLEVDLKDERHRLYRLLHRALAQEVHVVTMMEKYTYRPVPQTTSHVTVADLINDGNVGDLSSGIQEEFNSILDKLPRSLGHSELSQFQIDVPLHEEAQRHEVTLAFRL